MRGTLAEQMKATIYQYQLIRKINIRKESKWSHLVIALVLSAFQLLMYRTEGAIAIAVGILFTQIIHFIIIRLTLIRVDVPDYRKWSWVIQPPWIGYIPISHIELALFRRLHRHLLWLGLCAIGVAYPWANEAQMISLVSWHLWFLAPRIVVLRKLKKMRADGILKLHAEDISYYHR